VRSRTRCTGSALALWATVALLPGCHRIFPFEAGAASADAGGDAAHDAGPVCVREQLEIREDSVCPAVQCTNPQADTDCDGLGQAPRDPWPVTCNGLLYHDEFGTSFEERWASLYQPGSAIALNSGVDCGQKKYKSTTVSVRCAESDACVDDGASLCRAKSDGLQWSCGKLTLDKTSATLMPSAALAITVPAPLAEMRFSLDQLAGDWSVSISLTYRGNDWYYTDTLAPVSTGRTWIPQHLCEVWSNSEHTGGKPQLHFLNNQGPVETGCWMKALDPLCTTVVSPADGSIVQGGTYRLQTWYDSTDAHCRLLDAGTGTVVAHLRRAILFSTYLLRPTAPTTVRLAANNAKATVDYVRLFTPP